MTIDLKAEQQHVIDLAVRSGAYRNPGEVLDQAFEIIHEQLDLEDWMVDQREAVSAHIETGFAQAECGECREVSGVNAPFHLTAQAIKDLDAIWWFIANDNRTPQTGWKWRRNTR